MLELFCADIRQADERRARRKGRSPQKGSAFGVSLLEYAVRQVWNMDLPEMTPPGKGKPEFIGVSDMHFSVSHGKTHVLVAVSDAPVGVDVETHRDITDASAKVLMDEEEQEQFNFFDLWCLRESLFKFNGAGGLRQVLRFRRDGEKLIYPVPNVTGQLINGIEGCSAAVCREQEFILPEIHWVDAEKLCI